MEESVDPRDGDTDAAVGVAYIFAKNQRDDQDAGQDGKRVKSQAAVELEKQGGHNHEQEKIVNHGDDARGEEIVERVDVGGDSSHQTTDGVAVEITHGQAL